MSGVNPSLLVVAVLLVWRYKCVAQLPTPCPLNHAKMKTSVLNTNNYRPRWLGNKYAISDNTHKLVHGYFSSLNFFIDHDPVWCGNIYEHERAYFYKNHVVVKFVWRRKPCHHLSSLAYLRIYYWVRDNLYTIFRTTMVLVKCTGRLIFHEAPNIKMFSC